MVMMTTGMTGDDQLVRIARCLSHPLRCGSWTAWA